MGATGGPGPRLMRFLRSDSAAETAAFRGM